jgi:hypothetical protein
MYYVHADCRNKLTPKNRMAKFNIASQNDSCKAKYCQTNPHLHCTFIDFH